MILPILAYGDPILKKACKYVSKGQSGIKELVENMFETMYEAEGVGLAAPQVSESIRLFIMDSASIIMRDYPDEESVVRVFINPEILEEDDNDVVFNEGCLSIPLVREDVKRMSRIRIKYWDEDFVTHEEEFDGMNARIVLHEYDHVEGILFTDHLSPLKKRLLKNQLADITRGNIDIHYKMKFPLKKKVRR